jgi:hypothetical protein
LGVLPNVIKIPMNSYLFLNDPAPAVELPEYVSVIDAGKLIQQLISN